MAILNNLGLELFLQDHFNLNKHQFNLNLKIDNYFDQLNSPYLYQLFHSFILIYLLNFALILQREFLYF